MGIKKTIKFKTEVVNGVCPECNQDTLLVSVVPEMYKCTVCGENLRQHVNGKISYLPVLSVPKQPEQPKADG